MQTHSLKLNTSDRPDLKVLSLLYSVSRWDFPVEDKEYSTVLQQLPPALAIPADMTQYSKVHVDTMKVRLIEYLDHPYRSVEKC